MSEDTVNYNVKQSVKKTKPEDAAAKAVKQAIASQISDGQTTINVIVTSSDEVIELKAKVQSLEAQLKERTKAADEWRGKFVKSSKEYLRIYDEFRNLSYWLALQDNYSAVYEDLKDIRISLKILVTRLEIGLPKEP